MGLNALGRVQAREAGRRLAEIVSDRSTLDYVASPLGRTRETMELLRDELGLPAAGYRTDGRLVELTFGSWEGMTWREVRKRDPALAAKRERDKWAFVPPGGESYGMLRARIAPAIAALAGPAVIVSHGGVARALLTILAGLSEAAAPRIDIWQGRVLVLEAGSHRWV